MLRFTRVLVAGPHINRTRWLQVDLGSPTRVVGVITQGRPNTDKWEQWVTSYKILYGNSTLTLEKIQNQDSGADFVSYKDLRFMLQYLTVKIKLKNRMLMLRQELDFMA